MNEPYIFWCTPCKTRHGGDCAPKPTPAPAGGWDSFLLSEPPPEDKKLVPWNVGEVWAAHTPHGHSIVFKVLSPESNNRVVAIELLASKGWWEYTKCPQEIEIGRNSYFGSYCKQLLTSGRS